MNWVPLVFIACLRQVCQLNCLKLQTCVSLPVSVTNVWYMADMTSYSIQLTPQWNENHARTGSRFIVKAYSHVNVQCPNIV